MVHVKTGPLDFMRDTGDPILNFKEWIDYGLSYSDLPPGSQFP